VVSDDTLTKTLGELRRALRDDPRAPLVIETVHRRGVRFIAR
jgi:DNA-binding winged helix-turn-helix (wHTH) protein